jgi:F-type H+-transporting ATPase subunit gamma
MPTLKEYNVKLASLRTTRKMTNSMKLVSASKLRRAQEAQKNGALYVTPVHRIFVRLAKLGEAADHPLTKSRRHVRTVLMLVITSDRGLCGGFNNNLTKKVAEWRLKQDAAARSVEVSCYGRRGYAFFRNRAEIRKHYEYGAARPAYAHAQEIGMDVQAAFSGGGVDEVYLAYNAFHGGLAYTPAIERLLPFEPGSIRAAEDGTPQDWLYEPAAPELLQTLLPWLVKLRVYAALLSSAAAEHGARMTAMEQATTNADHLIEDLTLLRNRVRQAAITTELIEIVAGAEALK